MTRHRFFIQSLVACTLVLIGPGTCLPGGTGAIEFFRERVEIEVSKSTGGGYDIQVHGYYYFRNPTPYRAERRLFYPFPDFAGAGYPDGIRVVEYHDLLECGPIPAKLLKQGISFPVEVGPSSTALIRVDYLQHTEVARGVYITTTTSAWKKPLERAEFAVRLHKPLSLIEMSYPVENMRKDSGGMTVDIRFHDFMPEEDLIFRWGAGSRDGDKSP